MCELPLTIRKATVNSNASIGPGSPLSLEDARRIITHFVHEYEIRLHGALGYVTPSDKLLGRETGIFAERDRKLEAAREVRKLRRRAGRNTCTCIHYDAGVYECWSGG